MDYHWRSMKNAYAPVCSPLRLDMCMRVRCKMTLAPLHRPISKANRACSAPSHPIFAANSGVRGGFASAPYNQMGLDRFAPRTSVLLPSSFYLLKPRYVTASVLPDIYVLFVSTSSPVEPCVLSQSLHHHDSVFPARARDP